MTDPAFWDRIWGSTEPSRLAEYASRFDMSEDPMIRYLKERGAVTVCDAGCGCGLYALKLARHGFAVCGFDISEAAVWLAKQLLSENGFPVREFRRRIVLDSGCEDGQFDAVICRSVIDHLPLRDGAAAVRELLRIVRPGGSLLLTLDGRDAEYDSEPHTVDEDGDFLYKSGKWSGMVFHPYTPEEIGSLTAGYEVSLSGTPETGYTVMIEL